jgi:alkyl hydroperoxide reductase subunit AhpF
MPLLAEADRAKIQELFQDLESEVSITYFGEHESPLVVPGHECPFCKETREILEELASLTDKIQLQVKDILHDEQEARQRGISRVPAFEITGRAQGRVRFFGIPAGYEFATLIEDIRDVSRGSTGLSTLTS